MSQPFELVYSDGIPMDDAQHRAQMNLLIDLIEEVMESRGKEDYFAGGDMFVYYSPEQARDVAAGKPYFRGPDVFFVDDVPPKPIAERKAWICWEENGRLPDLIVELLSPSTEKIDRRDKMKLYSRTFRTREYFLYDVAQANLEGYRLAGDHYQPIRTGELGRLRSEVLGVDLGLWQGRVRRSTATWARLFQTDGTLVPTSTEAARQRAVAAEAEVERLRALLKSRG